MLCMSKQLLSFQDIIFKLHSFWGNYGCLIVQPYDTEKGAGTMSPHTFLRALGPKEWNVAYVEPSRRPTDGRYAENPNRLQHYFQFQVILKPSPLDIQELYVKSIEAIGIDRTEDDWESPTLGAAGRGWEVWCDGMEITQFTYFQQCGGFECKPVSVEITYGLERLAMFVQEKDHVMDIVWQETRKGVVLYRDIYQQSEIEQCHFNFDYANVDDLFKQFLMYETQCLILVEKKLTAPAYDYCLKCSHTFNLLDARGAISVSERANYILKIRKLAQRCAESYLINEGVLNKTGSDGN